MFRAKGRAIGNQANGEGKGTWGIKRKISYIIDEESEEMRKKSKPRAEVNEGAEEDMM